MRGYAFPCAAIAIALSGTPARAQTPAGDWTSQVSIIQSMGDYTEDPAQLRPAGMSFDRWRAWLGVEDMPADLRVRALNSATHVGLDIDAGGKIVNCRVLKPSEDARLDRLACDRLSQRGSFDPLFTAPARPVARQINLAVTWRTERRTEQPARPALAAPPPPSRLPGNEGWPRMRWWDPLRIDRFPDLQAIHDALPGKPGTGITTIELWVTPQAGPVRCDIGVGSGNPLLDAAACDTAKALPLSYAKACDWCGDGRLPLQFVWRRKGSYIAVPLPEEGAEDGIARDPADPRPAHRGQSRLSIRSGSVTAADFAGMENVPPRVYASLAIDAKGAVTRCTMVRPGLNPAVDARFCELMTKRVRFAPFTDIFGNPAPTEVRQTFNL